MKAVEMVLLAQLPPHLRSALEDALGNVCAHHDIEPTQRHAIYTALGAWGENFDTAGYRRRTRLALYSAYRVLPLIEKWLPESQSSRLLLLAQQVLEGKQDRLHVSLQFLRHSLDWQEEDPRAFRELLAIQQPLGILSADEAHSTVEQVSIASARALEVALFDELPSTHNHGDAAGWAWVAHREHSGISNPAHLLIAQGDAFWEWWAGQAAPAAWLSVPGDSTEI